MFNKSSFVAIVAGTAILAGAAGFYFAQSHVKDTTGRPQAIRQQGLSPEQRAERIADKYAVDKTEVLNSFKQGTSFQDLSKAAFFANMSKQPLQNVLAAKTSGNSWRDVANSLGLTPEQIKAARQEMSTVPLEKLQISKAVSLELMRQGYHARDIAMACKLAQNTGKTPAEVLSMRNLNNTWRDVAQTLGVSKDTLKQDIQDIRKVYPQWGRHDGNFLMGNLT